MTIKLDDNIYILEFKVDNKDNALQQIKDTNYQQKYMNDGKNIYLIGIDFGSDKKNITQFSWEHVN